MKIQKMESESHIYKNFCNNKEELYISEEEN